MPDALPRDALAFLGTLASGLVHEIKNPLSTIAINLALLEEDLLAALPHDRGLRRRVEALRGEVGRLEAALADFLRYAGPRRPVRRRHDLRAIAESLVEFVAPGFERDGISIGCDVKSVEVDVDAALLKQALLNLLLNAQQACARGGSVKIEGGEGGGGAVLVVADDGRGIAPEILPRVFDVYFSGSAAGSGLGLPTAQRIVEEHGGTVTIASEPGRGTRVTVTLPRAEGA
jgi:two-component system sensor histidine kinase HydH